MKLTIKPNIDFNSIILKHNILLQASNLAVGREGALQTEKELYLILAMLDNICEENVIEACNEDKRDLATIMTEDIEPVYLELTKDESYNKFYVELKELFLQRCKEIWDNQHSIMGLLDTILMALQNLTEDDKKEILASTAKIAEAAFDRRTAEMTEKVNETNDKLEAFVRKYQEQVNQQHTQEQKEGQEEVSDTK